MWRMTVVHVVLIFGIGVLFGLLLFLSIETGECNHVADNPFVQEIHVVTPEGPAVITGPGAEYLLETGFPIGLKL
jgi:hypothetical protein